MDVLRAKKWLLEIEGVYEEEVESHHGEEREDSQAGAEASPGAACVQADPVNKPGEGLEARTQNRKSDQVQASRSETCNSPRGCFLKFQLNQTKKWNSENSETTPALVKHQRRQNAALQSLHPSVFP